MADTVVDPFYRKKQRLKEEKSGFKARSAEL